ncbi:hypothetical protein AV521_10515 [Streptomyces sp. IMTB 2501]|uniref:hypothetical protein n=1 Tax=Streptomyces sp. IMTB 2501 TaxID=1776340 RepID=UPI00096FF0DF|nr:hypothetical protein [Streptomyces sp. IMTB 2501]OLZ71386.1 hypothetical protein AV521_10515 [Streptomyces sp. IMTB 2501]
MRARIAGVIESLLLLLIRALLPARGRRRASPAQLQDADSLLTTHPIRRRDTEAHLFWYDTPLVRPYLHEVEVFT